MGINSQMICKVCGRTITNEAANFCEYCGASFRPGMDNKISEEILRNLGGARQEGNQSASGYTQAGSQQGQGSQGMEGSVNAPKGFIGTLFNSSDRPMTFGNWLIIYLLPLIPMIGMVLFLVVLFSWGFGSNVAPTKKNWARATMVFVLIMILMLSVIISSGYLGDPNAVLESLYGTSSL
jgi:hypothetical protein